MVDTAEQPVSFRERKRQELSREHGEIESPVPNAPPEVEDQDRGSLDPAHQPPTSALEQEFEDQGPTPGESDELTDEQTEDGVDYSDAEGEVDEQDAVDWQTRYEEAEQLRQTMQADYTKKTQMLGEQRRNLEQGALVNEQIAQAYLTQADVNMRQWQNVNWQHLRATLDPTAYNQRVQQYQAAVASRDRYQQMHENIRKESARLVDSAKDAQVEISRDILRSTIPNWGNETYGSLRDFATNDLGWDAAEFDEVIDHKVIQLIFSEYSRRNSKSRIAGVTKIDQSAPPRNQNQPRRVRNKDGRFANLETAHRENPGDRDLSRDYFREKLRREREGR